MSKRNRNKFRVRDSINNSANSGFSSNAGQSIGGSPAAAAQSAGHAAEYRIISADLIRLVILNVIMLGIVLVIYFTNLHTNYLEKIFLKLFKI